MCFEHHCQGRIHALETFGLFVFGQITCGNALINEGNVRCGKTSKEIFFSVHDGAGTVKKLRVQAILPARKNIAGRRYVFGRIKGSVQEI